MNKNRINGKVVSTVLLRLASHLFAVENDSLYCVGSKVMRMSMEGKLYAWFVPAITRKRSHNLSSLTVILG
ncbi:MULTISPECIES: hypothetical protein [Aerosakkonema]|uniref:hypothetical protein n=1 Tax=Aerosakkonema TaxID=1246629 RepID=UPI0035BB5A44